MRSGQLINGQRIRSPLRAWRAGREMLLLALMAAQILPGCKSHFAIEVDQAPYIQAATAIEHPILETSGFSETRGLPAPLTLTSETPEQFWELSLEETIQIALANSKVFRDLGGIVLRSPTGVRSTYDPAIFETDPRIGAEAALSAFDATFASSVFLENNDRALNNQFFGGGTRILTQRATVFQSQIAKRTPFGSEFAFRHNFDYDANNAPGNQFPAAWNTNLEVEYRQSLLRGAGIDFGRIAGTSQTPGVYNGVLIARTNTDVSLADFEMAVRNFVSDVENAYWDLYFAYRTLDTAVAARNLSLTTWRRVQALQERGRLGGEADKEAEAREQYFRFQEEVENALTGRLVDGTRTYNGSSGGTFRGMGGVHVTERRLRYLLGIPVNGDELIRPTDEPARAAIVFDWDLSLQESLSRRPEIRRQKWMIKRRELELTASRNFLLPELDIVAGYRWRGFGRQLLRYDSPERFGSAWEDLVSGDFQESQLGVELAFPIGNRLAHTGVRNAEFLLARERALLHETEQRIVHDLSNTISEVERAYQVLQTVYNRREAARERVQALEAAFEADKAPLNLVLDAQRRLNTAQIRYYEALLEYNTAVKNMHYEKGTLLEYVGVHLSEGPWPNSAYDQAEDKLHRRLNIEGEHLPKHRIISKGPLDLP